MRVKIIINPYANRWRAQKRIPAIQKAFDEVDVEHVIVITSSPGQATEEARLAVEQGFDAVVAAGGTVQSMKLSTDWFRQRATALPSRWPCCPSARETI